MNTLIKGIFTGTWKSFKIFKQLGAIAFSTKDQFTQFEFTGVANVVIKAHHHGRLTTIANSDNWTVELKNRRHYMRIPATKLHYEIITVNHTVLVLADVTSGEKTFFAREHQWQDRLNANCSVIL